MPFTFQPLEIPEVVLITAKIFPDERGYFQESFKASDFAAAGLPTHFVQDNFSFSQEGVIRGLHYQREPQGQGKLVAVVKGSVWDVAVDIRPQSPTFKRWVAVELSNVNHRMLYIPVGFAHGFVATEDTYLFYRCTREYSPEHDAGVRWNDPDLGVSWNITRPVISLKDAKLPLLRDLEWSQ